MSLQKPVDLSCHEMDVSTDCGTTPAVDDDMADSQGTVLHVDLQFVLGEIQNFRMISHFRQKFVLWQKLPFECFFPNRL